ncbi:PhoH family protein [Treponema parvum]|uniref:PhoH-like protein n=1 Tax=Treponema parvum TaxID=138851 RepID=A0A975IDD3_9SPIR|nr:PhoH family protein [Treponema parvum]QTQ12044.1 PhoH family protein [Treponema parvum]QTQ15980.1 PhoH family protein [Treponema parvum]
MDSTYTIVVPDADVLARVCGTNDSNLRLIEEHLGVPVFTRGNELSVEKDDPAVQQKFRFIIDRIIDEIGDGSDGSEDMIASILHAGTHAAFETSSITVPGGIRKVYPRSVGQADYVQAMRKHDMVFCTGPAGSGKTFLAVAEALRLLMSHKKSSIILTRPIVEAGESLGFLPGDLEQKINPYLRPLFDAMTSVLPRETVRRLTESGVIETAPLAYMRGRTLSDSVIILDEAQNASCAQMKMFLTRMGENSKMFVTGDITQTDLPARTRSGLVNAIEILSGIPDIAKIEMSCEDVVRNPLVQKIVQAYENDKKDER